MESLRSWLPEEVAQWASERAADEPWWEQMLLNALALAGTGGARAVGNIGPDIVRLVLSGGEEIGLVVLVQPVDTHPMGHPEDVQRLVEALDTTFGSRRYVLYIRRRVPSGLDPAPIARAVRLWLSAVDSGEWEGRHAVYEDENVAIELTLAGHGERQGSSLLLCVGPVRALERLTALDARLVDLIDRHKAEAPGLPLVYCVGATQPSRVPRGYLQQLLYGTADWVHAQNVEWEYSASFSHSGRSLFGDPGCTTMASIWWLAPLPCGGFSSVALDNPWCEPRVSIPIAGTRFSTVETEQGEPSSVLRWTAPRPSCWSNER